MSDRELVIKIPEKIYKYVQQIGSINMLDTQQVANAIFDGKPLPKGHGRLLDEKEATALIAEGKNGDKAYFGTVNKDWEVIDFLKTVSTIIEADKGDKE